MKTFALTLLIAISALQGSPTFASEDSDLEVAIVRTGANERKAVIRIDNLPEDQRSLLKIKNKRGYILHSEVIHQTPVFVRSYDFSNMEDDTYLVEVINKEGTAKKKFDISPERDQIYFKPVVKNEEGVIKVVFKNPLNNPVKIFLYDTHDHLIYKTIVNAQEVYAQGLDVSHLNDGDYELTLASKGYSYTKHIAVK